MTTTAAAAHDDPAMPGILGPPPPSADSKPVSPTRLARDLERCTELLRQQAVVRAGVAQVIVQFLRLQLREALPSRTFDVRLFGSLAHGLYVPGHSKINLDVRAHPGPDDDRGGLSVAARPEYVLQILAARLQTSPALLCGAPIRHAVLVMHGTVDRPVELRFLWNAVPVHVSGGNDPGVAASDHMWRRLAEQPLRRMTLLHWKEWLRHQTRFLGPHVGQVSTYALFAILDAHDDAHFACAHDFPSFEQRARALVAGHLAQVPRRRATPDPLNAANNLTARAWDQRPVDARTPVAAGMGPRLALCLEQAIVLTAGPTS